MWSPTGNSWEGPDEAGADGWRTTCQVVLKLTFFPVGTKIWVWIPGVLTYPAPAHSMQTPAFAFKLHGLKKLQLYFHVMQCWFAFSFPVTNSTGLTSFQLSGIPLLFPVLYYFCFLMAPGITLSLLVQFFSTSPSKQFVFTIHYGVFLLFNSAYLPLS